MRGGWKIVSKATNLEDGDVERYADGFQVGDRDVARQRPVPPSKGTATASPKTTRSRLLERGTVVLLQATV